MTGVTIEQSSLHTVLLRAYFTKEWQIMYFVFVKYTVIIIVGFMNTTCGFHEHYTLAHC